MKLRYVMKMKKTLQKYKICNEDEGNRVGEGNEDSVLVAISLKPEEHQNMQLAKKV